MTRSPFSRRKPRLLDLYCKAGGAGKGYADAGFEVVGVDIEPQPNYPFEFIQMNALEAIYDLSWEFDAIHASPPCQAYTTLRHRTGGDYVDLVGETRRLLTQAYLPYVIENVVGAPLENPVMLCGTSFGLGVKGRELRRHRLFETNFPLMVPPCQHTKPVVGVYGTGGGGQMTRGFKAEGVADARVALGTPWMTLAECAQAIPPAYTEFIGAFLLVACHLRAAA